MAMSETSHLLGQISADLKNALKGIERVESSAGDNSKAIADIGQRLTKLESDREAEERHDAGVKKYLPHLIAAMLGAGAGGGGGAVAAKFSTPTVQAQPQGAASGHSARDPAADGR